MRDLLEVDVHRSSSSRIVGILRPFAAEQSYVLAGGQRDEKTAKPAHQCC